MTERLNPDQPRFCFVQDYDFHWFIIPEDQRDFWEEWLDSNGKDAFNAEWIVPEWARPIDTFRDITFTDPK